MPELPDVEGFKEVLVKHALRKTIDVVTVQDRRILGDLSVPGFTRRLTGARLTSARRHGKYLLAAIDRGGWLVLHFGMSGALAFVASGAAEPAFTRVRFDFAKAGAKGGALAYTNKRMIGRVSLSDGADDFIAQEKLGPDALDPHFGVGAFAAALAGTTRNVKSVLMDQEIVAGIGNIFSDEILFQARIDPALRADQLKSTEMNRLHAAMRQVLQEAVARGAGAEGFIERMPKGALLPERKKGGHCPRCGSPLKILKLAGRTAYCCPHCQKC